MRSWPREADDASGPGQAASAVAHAKSGRAQAVRRRELVCRARARVRAGRRRRCAPPAPPSPPAPPAHRRPAASRSRFVTRSCASSARSSRRCSPRCCVPSGGRHDIGRDGAAGAGGDQAGRLPQAGRHARRVRAGGAGRRSLLGRGLRVPRQADRSREAVVVGRHRHLPADEAARRWCVPLAAGRGRRDAADAWAARRAARRDRVGPGRSARESSGRGRRHEGADRVCRDLCLSLRRYAPVCAAARRTHRHDRCCAARPNQLVCAP